MPQTSLQDRYSSSSRGSSLPDDSDSIDAETSYTRTFGPPTTEAFSPSAALLSMASNSQPNSPYSLSASASPAPYQAYRPPVSYSPSPYPDGLAAPPPMASSATRWRAQDPFRALREHNIGTKYAWTVIPAAEGIRILDVCKGMSAARDDGVVVPCYNRETLFDEEWQAHMKDVHGVFLLWPETWMRRIEVLDLDAFGGDIGACNGVIMDR